MEYQIIETEFPHAAACAAAAENRDGTYTIYVNALHSREDLNADIRNLIAAIEIGGAA